MLNIFEEKFVLSLIGTVLYAQNISIPNTCLGLFQFLSSKIFMIAMITNPQVKIISSIAITLQNVKMYDLTVQLFITLGVDKLGIDIILI